MCLDLIVRMYSQLLECAGNLLSRIMQGIGKGGMEVLGRLG